MAGFRVGLQLYSLRDDMPKDPFGVVRSVAEAGFEGVEFAGFYDKPASEWRDFLRSLGLEVAGAHIGYSSFIGSELDKAIQYNRELGNRYLIIPGVPREVSGSRAGWLGFAKMLNDLSSRLRQFNMRIGYHTHWIEFQAIEGELPFHIVFGNTSGEVIMQVDIGHAIRAGLSNEDLVELFKRYQGRALSVHVKDYSRVKGYNVVVGEGDVKWVDVLAALAKYGGTQWLIIEQEEYPYKPPIESIKRSLKNLKDILSTI